VAPTPSAAEGSPTGGQQKPSSSLGFLVAGPALWWRGLKVVSRTPWLLWFFLTCVVVWGVLTALLAASAGPARFGWVLPPYVLPDENTNTIEYLQLSLSYAVFDAFSSLDMALTNLPGPLPWVVVVGVLFWGWAKGLRGHPTRVKEKGRAATLLFLTGVFCALAFLFVDSFLRLIGPPARADSYGPIARICYTALAPALAAVEAFMFGALGALVLLSSRNVVRFATAARTCVDRFWPLFGFYLFFHLQQLMSILLATLGLSPHFIFPQAVTRALSVLKLASTPLPFLIVAEGTSLAQGIKLLVQFYRGAFQRVWPLMAVTTAGLAVLYLARSATFLLAGPYRFSSQIVTEVIFLLSKVVVSLGGVAGMFLLIEEWRTHGATSGQGVER